MRRWDQYLDAHIRELEVRGLTAATICGRRRELERLGNWLKRKRPKPKLEEVTGEILIEYIRARTAFHSKATLSSVMSHMRCMGEYLLKDGIWQKNPMQWIVGPKLDFRSRLPKRIKPLHLQKLIAAAGGTREEHYRYLWVTILTVLYGTGMRRGELARLNVDDWSRNDGLIKVDGQKSNRERMVPVHEIVAMALEAYLPIRHNLLAAKGKLNETALFVGKSGSRIAGVNISTAVHRMARRAAVPLVTIHQFRHSCASDLIESGASLPEVKKLLGHAAISTTMRYTQIADPEKVRAMKSHPINSILETSEFQYA